MNSQLISKKTTLIVLSTMIAIGLTTIAESAVAKTLASVTTQPASPKTTAQAIQAAEKEGAFLMVIFFDKKDDLVKDMDQTVTTFAKKASEKIKTFHADVNDKAEAETVKKYGIVQAKLPLLLVFAPNGVITRGYEQKVTAEKLAPSLVSELVAKIIKAVRDQKVAVVELKNNKTKFNTQSANVASELANDPSLKGHVEVIQGDPSNPKNLDFLTQCDIKINSSNATLVLLAPPAGTIMGVFPGDTVTKDELLNALKPKASGCCPGGSGGCK